MTQDFLDGWNSARDAAAKVARKAHDFWDRHTQTAANYRYAAAFIENQIKALPPPNESEDSNVGTHGGNAMADDVCEKCADLVASLRAEVERLKAEAAAYFGALYAASLHDRDTCDPSHVGLNGVVIRHWREGYCEGIKDAAEGFASKLAESQREAFKADVITAYEKEKSRLVHPAALQEPEPNERTEG